MTIKEIKIEFPPNYTDMLETFPLLEAHKPVFCWGEILYNPYNQEITPDLLVHESVHALQQADASSVEDWYRLYQTDASFRLEVEVDSYRAQYTYLSRQIKDRTLLFKYLQALSTVLASSLYKLPLTTSEARKLIAQR